eukprot:CAMPEP_0176475470 /NCGR_PEP_ID=MMETSP0127-20121128/43622_1 /TAXON_ID=938130 /ORGANISM="Platyophrya macrostoma, Strain WH" /LENGTH=331 /DNA_ID=CAMNT_0017871065 /DNA_START=31 /DNA_END=1026 /DNA_ORIENTATION=+
MNLNELSEPFPFKTEEVDALDESLESGEENSNQPGDSQEKNIKRRIRVGKKYHHIKNTIRKQLISRVESKGEKIIEVAKELGMKYSTAKSILKVYRSEGRTNKIPKSQRYLSLRVPDPDDFLPLPTRNSKRSSSKKPLVETVAPEYEGRVTRRRATNKEAKEKFPVKSEETESADFYNEEEEEVVKEPKLKKKVKKGVIPKVEAEELPMKEEVVQEEYFVAKKEEKETTTSPEISVKIDEEKAIKPTLKESSYEGLRNFNMPLGYPPHMYPGLMPSIMPRPNFDPYHASPYGSDLSQIRIQNMAMYLQAIRLQGLMLKNRTAQNLGVASQQ